MIEKYSPRNYGKEYVKINGSDQYPMFVLTSLGIKPCFDDWVDVNKYEEFVSVCSDYGLCLVPGLIFTELKIAKQDIVGKDTITTTMAEFLPFDKNAKEGKVHVFVARTKEIANNTKKAGWYTGGVVNNRAINKPFVDHLRFGKELGFPDCCISFFKTYNNWTKFSHPLETFKNTFRDAEKKIGSYYCNNFLMDNTYFFIHHLPCSYRCEKTINYARLAEEKFRGVEPGFVKTTLEFLKRPLLVFGERHFIMFKGRLEDDSISYSEFYYNLNPARPEDKIAFLDDFSRADSVSFAGNTLRISRNGSIIKELAKNPTWFMMGFE